MTSREDCPAARLAREAAAAVDALQRADRAHASDEVEDLSERLEAIGIAVSNIEARSALGAYFQALILYGEAHPDNDWFSDTRDGRRAARRMQRLTASLSRYLESTAAVATARSLRRYYQRDERDGEPQRRDAPPAAQREEPSRAANI